MSFSDLGRPTKPSLRIVRDFVQKYGKFPPKASVSNSLVFTVRKLNFLNTNNIQFNDLEKVSIARDIPHFPAKSITINVDGLPSTYIRTPKLLCRRANLIGTLNESKKWRTAMRYLNPTQEIHIRFTNIVNPTASAELCKILCECISDVVITLSCNVNCEISRFRRFLSDVALNITKIPRIRIECPGMPILTEDVVGTLSFCPKKDVFVHTSDAIPIHHIFRLASSRMLLTNNKIAHSSRYTPQAIRLDIHQSCISGASTVKINDLLVSDSILRLRLDGSTEFRIDEELDAPRATLEISAIDDTPKSAILLTNIVSTARGKLKKLCISHECPTYRRRSLLPSLVAPSSHKFILQEIEINFPSLFPTGFPSNVQILVSK